MIRIHIPGPLRLSSSHTAQTSREVRRDPVLDLSLLCGYRQSSCYSIACEMNSSCSLTGGFTFHVVDACLVCHILSHDEKLRFGLSQILGSLARGRAASESLCSLGGGQMEGGNVPCKPRAVGLISASEPMAMAVVLQCGGLTHTWLSTVIVTFVLVFI